MTRMKSHEWSSKSKSLYGGTEIAFFFWSAETGTQAIVSPYLPGDKKCLGGLKGVKETKGQLITSWWACNAMLQTHK